MIFNSITAAGAFATAVETARRADAQAQPRSAAAGQPTAKGSGLSLPLIALWRKHVA